MASRKKTLLVARATFTCEHGGQTVVVQAGQTVDSTDALVRGREGLFAAVEQPDHETSGR